MTAAVIHHPRLAWDGARTVVHSARFATTHDWLLGSLCEMVPAELVAHLTATRSRLTAPGGADAENVEAGVWRVRFEDLLRARPELAAPLQNLFNEAAGRLADARASVV